MKTFLRSLAFALCLLPTLAFSQSNLCINDSGGACNAAPTGAVLTPTGMSFASSAALFAKPSSSLQFSGAFSVSFGVKFTGNPSSGTPFISDLVLSPLTGFDILFYTSFTNSYQLLSQIFPGIGGTCSSSMTCSRTTLVNDGNWHEYCTTYDPSSHNIYTYIDGILRDQGRTVGTFTNTTIAWQVGGVNQPIVVRDMWVWHANIGAVGCGTKYQLSSFGLSPNVGPLTLNVVAHWPMDNCNGTGCTDSSGNSNDLIFDSGTPTCSVTAPSGTISGTQNMTVTATDPSGIGIASVSYYADGAFVGTSTTGPSFSVALNTVHYADGTHTITAYPVNPGGVLGTCGTTVTTSNSVSNKTFYISSAVGSSDSNDCLHQTFTSGTSGPCATLGGLTAKISANPLIGGDSVLAVSGSSFTISGGSPSTTLTLIGPNGATANYGISQNVFPGKTITIGTTSPCVPLTGVTTNCATVTLTANSWTPDGGNYRLGMITGNNISNVTVQGWILNFNAQPAAMCDQCAWGIFFGSAGNNTSTGILVQNNVVIDADNGIWASSQFSFAGSNGGHLCNATLQDNIVHGSSPTGPLQTGLMVDSGACLTGATGGTLTSNYVYNLGMSDGGYRTAGYTFISGTVNAVASYNVSGILGASSGPHCGNYYAFDNDGVLTATIQGIESYNNEASSNPPGCDGGALDMDIGTSGLTLQYNYTHNTWGPSLNVLNGARGTISSGNRIVRYNIFEDSWQSLTGNGFPGQVRPDFVYNNNLYNGFNGGTNPYNNTVRTMFAYSLAAGTCPLTGSYIADNIMAATAGAGNANFLYLFQGGTVVCAGLTFKNNDYWAIAGTPTWTTYTTYNSVAAWEASPYGETNALGINPNFAGTVGNNNVCYSIGAVPVQPGTIPCPAAYEVTTGSGVIGTGISDSFSPTQATADFYANTVPNGVGSGYNIGADGAHH